jgi:type VI secretion system secreted protein Hcp
MMSVVVVSQPILEKECTMAFDAFLKVDGVPGESGDDKHKDWIEILSFHWGVSQPASGSASSGGARSAERCNHTDFSFVHTLDKASPKLFLNCCNGKHLKEITLELCRATGDKQKYMEYKLTDAIVSSVRPGGASQGGESLPLEEVSFNYGKIELSYTECDHKTGKPKGDVKSNWDLTANKGA